MKKIVLPIIAAVTAFSLIGGCTKSNIANLESQGNNIICFGDSITHGKGSGPGMDYPSLLASMTRLHVINAGINSDTTGEALKRLKTDVLERDPLIVIIEFGGNDFLGKTPSAETFANVEQMIQVLQKQGVMVALADISTSFFMEQYGAEFRKMSRKYGVILIPHLLDGIITNPDLKSDPIHPNGKGYKIIAYRIYRGIIPYLNQNAMLRKARAAAVKQEKQAK
ncbi:MAG: GDSL-type esterase/lipase family protein [Deltaproteobacteria bacterium]